MNEETNIVDTIEKDGKIINLTRQGEYGFIYLVPEKGFMPAKYAGAYTGVDYAKIAANQYLEEYKEAKQSLLRNNKEIIKGAKQG